MWSSGLGIVSLKISDLFFEEGFIKITGKGNKQRFVPIGSLAQKYIHIYKSTIRIHLNVKHGDVLFLNRRKSTYKSDDFTIIKDLAVKIECIKDPHTFGIRLRHIFSKTGQI
jgi:integrase/recombinase XerD